MMTIETAKHRVKGPTTPRGPVLQRKCACGGTPGPTGACAACRRQQKLGIQAKLHISRPGDRYEKEADRMARRVTQSSMSARPPQASRETRSEPVDIPTEVEATLKRPGKPLGAPTRSFMEPRFGYNFSRVRVHTGKQAARSAQMVNALAYTVGHDIVFGAGQYAPESARGRSLLAHELTHVIQQGGAETRPHPSGDTQSAEVIGLNAERQFSQPVGSRIEAEPFQGTSPVRESRPMIARQGGDCPSALEITWKCGLSVMGCVGTVLAGIAASPTGIGLAAAILAVISTCGLAGTVCGELIAKYMRCQGTEGIAQLADPEGVEAAQGAA